MPYLRDYHILISHSWSYSEEYDKVCSWLNESTYFKWSDFSVCCNRPLETKSNSDLEKKLRERIAHASCIIVISGMYAGYSRWIDFEIDTALDFRKPIISVKPWGQQRTPIKIQENSDVMVGWNANSIINAVRQYAL